LSSNSRHKSKNDADEAVSVVSLISSSGGYINGRNSANLELLIDKTSSIYLIQALLHSLFLLKIIPSPAIYIYTVHICLLWRDTVSAGRRSDGSYLGTIIVFYQELLIYCFYICSCREYFWYIYMSTWCRSTINTWYEIKSIIAR
jgi:hypothetical protein